MSNFIKHLIIYSSENNATANQLLSILQNAGQEAMLLEKTDEDYSEQIGQVNAPVDSSVILLLTDNFIKTYGCMNGILQAAHKWGDDSHLSVVVADGVSEDENGELNVVETKFERVGEIIQYMNFWQDRYLDLRKEKRKKKNDEELDEKISVTKEISGDVGEFLRFVRGYGYHDIESFLAKYAEVETTQPEGASILPSPPLEVEQEPPLPDEKSLVEMIEDSSFELMAENADLDTKAHTADLDDEVTDEILSSIPGLDLLEDKEGITASSEDSLLDDLLSEEDSTSGAAPSSESEVMPNGHFTEKELEKLDDENEELMSILDEVLIDEGLEPPSEKEEYQFVGDDPDNPEDFDIDSLFEEENRGGEPSTETKEGISLSENEVLLNLVEDGGDDNSSDEILETAVDYFRENKNHEGIAFLANAVQTRPTDTSLRYYHAYALARYSSKYEDAQNELNTLLEQDHNHPDGWFLMAEIAESKEDFAKAKECFEKVIEVNPHFPEVQYRLGLLLSEQFEGQEENAANHLTLAIEQNERNVDALYLLAILLNEHLNQPEEAVKYFRKALNLQPKHPFANYDLALVYHGLNDMERAAEFYEKAVAINPELRTEQNDQAFYVASSPSPEPIIEEQPEAAVSSDEIEEEETIIEMADDPESELMGIKEEEETTTEEEETEEQEKIGQEKEDLKTTETVVTIADKDTPVIKTKIVMITGATAGIGKATAELFARNGYNIIITGRRTERLKELQEEFTKKYSTKCQTLAFDVRDPQLVKNEIDSLPEEFKDIDILINNAGLSRGIDPIHEGSIEDWETMIDTNVKGLLYMTKAIAPQMVERKTGHIINVSSIAGTEVYPGGNVYCASKAAVSSLTRSMRLDLHIHNIRVSQVAPGHVEETEFARVRFDWDKDKASKVYENFQPLKSSDVAETIYFIATRPPHVNIQDIYMFGTQQASATMIERSGR